MFPPGWDITHSSNHKKQFSEQLLQQIHSQPNIDILEPVDLSMAATKHISVQWLVKMWEWLHNRQPTIYST